MLDLRKNRLDYGKLLMPPEGHILTHAVATTYSLDLYTLLAIPIALFYSKILDGNFENNRFDVLESIQKSAAKLTIYCQKGKIKVPGKFNWLFAYIEDSIYEITPPDYRSSFHPKVWILRFEKDSNIKYRVIVLSRNLTFDRSWDLAFHIDGSVTNRNYTANKPLLDFAKHLFTQKRVKDFSHIQKELSKVKFEAIDKFTHLVFHPIGINSHQNPLNRRKFKKLLIISPFVDKTSLEKLHQNCPNRKVLISREEELQQIPETVLNDGYEPYFLSRRIVEGEASEELDETDLEPQKQQLHAKLFIGKSVSRYYWFLGSANCTAPAFTRDIKTRNIEFMVELIGNDPRTSPDDIKNVLIPPDEPMPFFEEFEPCNGQEDEEVANMRNKIRRLEHDLIKTVFRGTVVQQETTDNFDLFLIGDMQNVTWDEDIVVKIAPIGKSIRKIRPNTLNKLKFINLSEVDLSPFVCIRIYFDGNKMASFLVKMEIELPESRKSKILQRLISTQDKFFDYINFLVSGKQHYETLKIENNDETRETLPNGRHNNTFSELPVFENLIMTAARNPRQLKAINRLIEKLSDEKSNDANTIIPNEFFELWKVIKQAVN